MINYVNNSFDKVLKPCDAQQFATLTQSELTEKLILAHRAGDPKAKSKLPAITYMGVLDAEKYTRYIKQCREQGTKPQGSRRAEFMRPTGLLMLDFDHVPMQAQTSSLASLGEGVIPSEERDLAASPAKSQREILRVAQNDMQGGASLGEGVIPSEERDLAVSPAKSQREILRVAQNDRAAVIDSPVKLWEYIQKRLSAMPEKPLHRGRGWGGSPEGDGRDRIALAHITPSGDGLRVVVKRPVGMSIEQAQYEWCRAMEFDKVGIKPDAVCKDISRLSFAPMQKEILYYNPSLLFAGLPDAADYPDGSLFSQSTQSSPSTQSSFPADYDGIGYDEIVRRLEAQLGGAPSHGARNSFIFSMACNLRYICNDDAAWVASILPTYGEEPQKHRQTIQSAINRPMSRNMPDTLKRALLVSAESTDTAEKSAFSMQHTALAPALPKALPEPIRLLVSRTPDIMRPAVAMSVFPALGAHVKDTHFSYWDGRDYEPTFMNVLVAELSMGKSAVNRPLEYILADIEERDMVHLKQELEWKAKCSRLASTQDKPERPKGLVVQILSSDMTNAAFVQRLADAEGHFLYTQMDEIELLNALKTNGASNMVSAVLRLAFDCGKYGQERVAANAVSAKVRVRWNWNASTTVQRVRKFFARNIADGTLSRLSFATIIKPEDDWGDKSKPHYGRYDEEFAEALRPYIDRLGVCSGTIHCPEAAAWADRLGDELVAFAREAEDRSYAQFSFRAVLMGFFRAMLLYVMNGMQWSEEIEEFATWTVKYDLWCKMRFFRDMMHSELEGERTAIQRGPVGLLTMLPKEFTRDQVRDLRIAQGMKPDPKVMLSLWKGRGLIVDGEVPGTYVRV